jgi:hypothetical protein
MKTKLTTLLILLLIPLLLQVEGKKRKVTASTFTPTVIYVEKGYEAFYSAPEEVTIVGPDINSTITLRANPDLPISFLEQDATLIVRGLASNQ